METPPPSSQHHHYGALTSVSILALPIILITVIAVAIAIFLLLRLHKAKCNKRKRSIQETQGSQYASSFNSNSITCSSVDSRSCIYAGKLALPLQARRRGQVFTYGELEAATDGFSQSNMIGNGGFGVVYRGSLRDGTVAAIKMLHRDGKHREREFRTEVDLLTRLHSEHLVGLIGYCADQHHRLLVFEFMSNGSLRQHLHHHHHQQPLDWLTRLRIALDCARGLEFLHEHIVPTIIHRDLNCSNILLDHNYRAKVSDFGMAKTGSDKINGQVLTRVFGTTGYIAPEYAATGNLTTKSDVYSYGVVLLELLTGRVPVDITRPPTEHVLVSWALPRLTNKEKVVEMVDPALKGQYSMKDLIQIAAIAAVCVQSEADYRPLMIDVVQSLIPLVRRPSGSFHVTPCRSEQDMEIPSRL